MNTPINQLTTKGFVSLPYSPEFNAALDRAIQSWKKFCALPTAIKKGLPYSSNNTGVGYELKEGAGHMGDRKENFDMTVDGRHWLDAHASQIADPVALDFVKDVTALVPLIKPLALDFARIVREAYRPLFGFVGEVEQSEGSFFVRFIHYAGDRKVGEETAVAHVDQSAFTLHLFESDPGFQCLNYREKMWVDVPVSPGETVILPALQLQLRSRGRAKALCHRVVATETTAQTGRYSAVCFVQLRTTPKYDKDAHGRLQEKTPGFNYDLSFEEVQKLFKK